MLKLLNDSTINSKASIFNRREYMNLTIFNQISMIHFPHTKWSQRLLYIHRIILYNSVLNHSPWLQTSINIQDWERTLKISLQLKTLHNTGNVPTKLFVKWYYLSAKSIAPWPLFWAMQFVMEWEPRIVINTWTRHLPLNVRVVILSSSNACI